MVSFVVKESSAGQAVGTDLMAATGTWNRFRISNTWRKIRRIGVAGSSAAYNASVDVYYGATLVATNLNNTTSGAVGPKEAGDILPLVSDYWCEPGEPLIIQINTASATNALQVFVELLESARRPF